MLPANFSSSLENEEAVHCNPPEFSVDGARAGGDGTNLSGFGTLSNDPSDALYGGADNQTVEMNTPPRSPAQTCVDLNPVLKNKRRLCFGSDEMSASKRLCYSLPPSPAPTLSTGRCDSRLSSLDSGEIPDNAKRIGLPLVAHRSSHSIIAGESWYNPAAAHNEKCSPLNLSSQNEDAPIDYSMVSPNSKKNRDCSLEPLDLSSGKPTKVRLSNWRPTFVTTVGSPEKPLPLVNVAVDLSQGQLISREHDVQQSLQPVEKNRPSSDTPLDQEASLENLAPDVQEPVKANDVDPVNCLRDFFNNWNEGDELAFGCAPAMTLTILVADPNEPTSEVSSAPTLLPVTSPELAVMDSPLILPGETVCQTRTTLVTDLNKPTSEVSSVPPLLPVSSPELADPPILVPGETTCQTPPTVNSLNQLPSMPLIGGEQQPSTEEEEEVLENVGAKEIENETVELEMDDQVTDSAERPEILTFSEILENPVVSEVPIEKEPDLENVKNATSIVSNFTPTLPKNSSTNFVRLYEEGDDDVFESLLSRPAMQAQAGLPKFPTPPRRRKSTSDALISTRRLSIDNIETASDDGTLVRGRTLRPRPAETVKQDSVAKPSQVARLRMVRSASLGRSSSPVLNRGRPRDKKNSNRSRSSSRNSLPTSKLALSQAELIAKERDNLIQHDSWLEQRRLMYSTYAGVDVPGSKNMQPVVVLERDPKIDAMAIALYGTPGSRPSSDSNE